MSDYLIARPNEARDVKITVTMRVGCWTDYPTDVDLTMDLEATLPVQLREALNLLDTDTLEVDVEVE